MVDHDDVHDDGSAVDCGVPLIEINLTLKVRFYFYEGRYTLTFLLLPTWWLTSFSHSLLSTLLSSYTSLSVTGEIRHSLLIKDCIFK